MTNTARHRRVTDAAAHSYRANWFSRRHLPITPVTRSTSSVWRVDASFDGTAIRRASHSSNGFAPSSLQYHAVSAVDRPILDSRGSVLSRSSPVVLALFADR